MIIKFFFGIYERVVKAKLLVREKVLCDLAELTEQEKIELNIVDADTGQLNRSIFEDLFITERYESLLKAIFMTTTLQSNSGLQNAGYNIFSSLGNQMDTGKFEDFSR